MQTVGRSEQASFTDLNSFTISPRIGIYSSELLGWGYIEPRWWRNYLHVHSYFEVCYAFQGRGSFRIQEQEICVQAGDVFVAKPGEAHEIQSDEKDPLGIYYWYYTLLAGEAAASPGEVDSLLANFLETQRYRSSQVPGMLRTIELLKEEVTRREVGCEQIIQGLVVKLLLDTARAVTEPRVQASLVLSRARNSEEVVVQLMLRYLRDNYSRSLSVRDIAAEVHLSERHANRLFHKVMKIPIMEYLIHLRLEIAGQQLLEQAQSIKEIAVGCGYADVRHFTTLFRKHYGVTPAVFRASSGTRFLSTAPEGGVSSSDERRLSASTPP